MEDEIEITWVSRSHGDKYGYDFVTYNETLDQYIFYEVKTTINPFKLDKFKLTENVFKKFQKISDLGITNETVKFVIASILINETGIIDEIDYYRNFDLLPLIELNQPLIILHKDEVSYGDDSILSRRIVKK